MPFLLYADIFSKSIYSKIFLRNTIRELTSLDPGQTCISVGLICVQTVSRGNKQTKKVVTSRY